MRTERRSTPRMRVNGLAYVNLEPDNGGVILDISEGGLCFQSTAPVKRTETIRFWFSYRGLRVEPGRGLCSEGELHTRGVSRLIEVRSELAWTDETLKRGGLRFTNLSDTAREQIRDWIRQPALVHVNGGGAGIFPSVRQSSTLVARVASAKVEVVFRRIQSSRVWNRFSGGLVTGIVASAFLVGAVSEFTHSHVLGNSLVELGERLGGKSLSPVAPAQQASSLELEPASVVPQATLPESKTGSTDSNPGLEPAAPAPAKAQPPEKLLSMVPATVIKPPAKKLDSERPVAPSLPAQKPPAPATPTINLSSERPPVPGIGFTSASDVGRNAPRPPTPEISRSSRPTVSIEPSKIVGATMRSEKYLEIGKFKEKPLADQATQRLSQLGFPATIMQRSRWFVKSYQVLVGPYGSDPEAEAVHKDLSSRGFSPRSYERGKREFYMPPALQVGNARLPVGPCVVSWESYVPDALVRFEDEKGTNVTAQAKWLKQSTKYSQDAVGYDKNSDGSRTLVEIRFSGMAQTLVFENVSK
jgi:cell division protein FtsN